MRYMLLCYDDERPGRNAGKPKPIDAAMDEAVALTHELDAKGQYILASPLARLEPPPRASASATARPLVTDGPFAETREVLGGFYVIDVDNLDQAIAIAARHPGARLGSVEVRPILEIPGLPQK